MMTKQVACGGEESRRTFVLGEVARQVQESRLYAGLGIMVSWKS